MPAPDPMPVGYRFADFEIQGELGLGHTCRVYKALDLRSDRVVALNVPFRLFRDHGSQMALMSRIGRLVTAGNKRICALGQCDGVTWVSVEYVEGQDAAVDR